MTSRSWGWGRELRRRIVSPLRSLFTRGAAPRDVARCAAFGCLIGLCPVYGTNSLTVTFLALKFRLNLPAIHAFNWLMAGPQLALWIPFMRIGERLCLAAPVALAPDHLIELVRADFWGFARQFGWSVAHAAIGWMALAAPAAWLAYRALWAVLERRRRRRSRPRSGECTV